MNAQLNGKSIAVLGLGISNIAVIGYLIKHDLKRLTVFDTRSNPPYVEELPRGIDIRLGALDADELASYDLMVVSPGLSINLPEIAKAMAKGVKAVGDIELFAFEAKAPVVGITGSNGKSTVTALVGMMIELWGKKSAVGANFGRAVFDILSDDVDYYVLELSSFELETTSSLKLAAGVILNISEDHLDRYEGSIELYTKAKARIYRHCNNIIVNRDDKATFPDNKTIKASFGLDNKEYGREEEGGRTYLTVNAQRIIDTSELIICGTHNELNALAAMALADCIKVPREVQLQALRTFPGLEHRCQLIRIINNIAFYNDSKATNVASTEAAIAGLSSRYNKGIILLAGGLGKGQDFTPLKKYLGKEVTAMFCFGKDAPQLLALSKEYGRQCLNMRQAINAAYETAKSGQAILLSPACASFDQFKGFEDRGRVFSNLVNHLVDKEN